MEGALAAAHRTQLFVAGPGSLRVTVTENLASWSPRKTPTEQVLSAGPRIRISLGTPVLPTTAPT